MGQEKKLLTTNVLSTMKERIFSVISPFELFEKKRKVFLFTECLSFKDVITSIYDYCFQNQLTDAINSLRPDGLSILQLFIAVVSLICYLTLLSENELQQFPMEKDFMVRYLPGIQFALLSINCFLILFTLFRNWFYLFINNDS
jgi:hypothetical protein